MLDKIEGLLQENQHLKASNQRLTASLIHANDKYDASMDFCKSFIKELKTIKRG